MTHHATCTCQDCRDAAEADAQHERAEMLALFAVATTGEPMTVICGGCDQPMRVERDGETIITQRPCPCGWGNEREGLG